MCGKKRRRGEEEWRKGKKKDVESFVFRMLCFANCSKFKWS